MKIKSLAIACALACSSQAYALTPTVVANVVTNADVTLFVSGSSALQTMIGQTAGSMLTNMDVFFDGTTLAPATGKNYRGYFGQANAAAIAAYPSLETAPGSGIGKNVLIYETALGGSIQGVNPVGDTSLFNTALGVKRLNMTGCTASGTDAATLRPLWNCTAAAVAQIPDAGISDLDPATNDAAINLPAGGVSLTPAQLGALNSKSVLGVLMGITVTSGAPAALQSLSKAQVAGLMGGYISDWSMIEPTATGKSVIVCRRGAGSGTQSVINASIFGNPCMSGGTPPLTYTATSAPLGSTTAVAAGNVVVIENSSSGNVKTCMAAAKLGTAAGAFTGALGAINVTNGNLVAAGTANSVVLPVGGYAVGVLGLDGGTTANYTFASINGSAPTVANAATGHYDIIGEATFNDRGDLTGAKADVFAMFSQNAGDPAILGVSGAGGTPIPGVAALSENGWAASTPFNPANPVLRAGNFGNMCAPLSTLQ